MNFLSLEFFSGFRDVAEWLKTSEEETKTIVRFSRVKYRYKYSIQLNIINLINYSVLFGIFPNFP